VTRRTQTTGRRPPKLILLLKNSPGLSDAQIAEPQMILGLAIIAVGTILDRAFAGAGLPAAAAPYRDSRRRRSTSARPSASRRKRRRHEEAGPHTGA